MFFRYHTQPARLLRLFRAFYHQALRLRRFRYAYGGFFLALVLAYWTALRVSWDELASAHPTFGDFFPPFAALGSAFLLLAWGFGVVFGRYPYSPMSLGGKIALAIGLLIPAGIFLAFFGEAWDSLPANPFFLLAQPERRWEVVLPWLWATAWVWVLGRGIVWLRLRGVLVEEFELDYLHRVLRPLLSDLPETAVCSLACNPFSPIWTAKFEEKDVQRHQFHTRDDVLLEFRAVLPDGLEFGLRTLHRRIEKYKRGRKKIKYKGTKHRLAQSYRFEHPAIAALGQKVIAKRQWLETLWKQRPEGYTTMVRAEPKQARLVVVQKKKFAGFRRELKAEDLPSAELTLDVVRRVSGGVIAPAAQRA